MKKIIHITTVLVLMLSVSHVKAQTDEMSDYWKDVDFSDTSLVSSDVFDAKVVDFLFTCATLEDGVHFDSLSMAGINVLMGKAKVNMRVYEYLLDYLLNGYSAMGQSSIVEYLLNYPQLAEGEITKEEGSRLDSIAEPFQKVKVGAKAPDYMGFSINGEAYRLYESNAPHTIVVFWSADCEFCHDFLVQIRKHLDLKSDFELVTFALAENEGEVKEAVKRMRLPGYHFYDELRWDGKAFMEYHITSTPTVFVLDENKTIVCKPYDWKDLKYWLKSNNISY